MNQHYASPSTRRRRFATTSPDERAKWVSRFRQSGQTQRAFAATHGFSVSALNCWLREVSAPAASAKLQEIPAAVVASALQDWEAELVLPDRRVLRLRGNWVRPWIMQWMEGSVCSH